MIAAYDPSAPAFLPTWRNLSRRDLIRAGALGPSPEGTGLTYRADGVLIREHPEVVMLREEVLASVLDYAEDLNLEKPLPPEDLRAMSNWWREAVLLVLDARRRERVRRLKTEKDSAGKGVVKKAPSATGKPARKKVPVSVPRAKRR